MTRQSVPYSQMVAYLAGMFHTTLVAHDGNAIVCTPILVREPLVIVFGHLTDRTATEVGNDVCLYFHNPNKR